MKASCYQTENALIQTVTTISTRFIDTIIINGISVIKPNSKATQEERNNKTSSNNEKPADDQKSTDGTSSNDKKSTYDQKAINEVSADDENNINKPNEKQKGTEGSSDVTENNVALDKEQGLSLDTPEEFEQEFSILVKNIYAKGKRKPPALNLQSSECESSQACSSQSKESKSQDGSESTRTAITTITSTTTQSIPDQKLLPRLVAPNALIRISSEPKLDANKNKPNNTQARYEKKPPQDSSAYGDKTTTLPSPSKLQQKRKCLPNRNKDIRELKPEELKAYIDAIKEDFIELISVLRFNELLNAFPDPAMVQDHFLLFLPIAQLLSYLQSSCRVDLVMSR
ncbi:hypothetical protein DSO57_1035017 [Entomophthora muscae]|uniref:Uncharacterized protein n=1 Tax=Entomophthora muscae TaxID=34485 RepID=A0ACC2U992_9FUNG|nr:hypothetical protein DSO57_1035017 [Entomophthora muscae]